MRIAAHHEAQGEAVSIERFEFLETARRNVGSIIEPRNAMLAARAIDLERGEVALTR